MGLMEKFNDVYELAKKVGTLDLQEKIMSLREEIQSLRERNLQLTDENLSLKKQSDTEAQLYFDGHVYWQNPTDHHGRQGPFCPRCHDVIHSLVHLQRSESVAGPGWLCLECKNFYDKGDSRT